jgi:type II secretory pathway pseudopilin PulG
VGPRGVQGKQGKQGERGERGLSRLQGRAVVVLFVIAAALGGFNLFWTAHEVNAASAAQQHEQASQQQQAAQQQAAQRAQGAAFERRLCTTLGRLAALAPPPGSPLNNPSRAYLQAQHAVLAELGPDVGCKERP